ncbi:homogentisate 1,2-dioxygenase [Thalassospira povalilytica]|uniref:Homogentisate 1,2-dioxygenase n=1 Tax=Thalassospira povalilytica TaxID=732237 RepID=A0A8I1SIK0_9PROT|nr:homogentisate 1,2-dioxygenase [Thalassospira povalilytica]MBN8195849.1 homogentisate 1,2-dioxygenase [Thalassospira povalilytica]
MTNWIRLPNSEGACTPQSDTRSDQPTYQRHIGRKGFQGPSAQIYHRHPPVGWATFEGPLRPRAFDLAKLAPGPACPLQARRILRSDSMEVRYWKTDAKMHALSRNADGDTLMFVHNGEGALFCDYGHLPYRDGDYILLPRGTAWRVEPAGHCEFMLIEATADAFGLPEPGTMAGGTPLDPMMFTVPCIDDAFRAQQDDAFWEIHIKRKGQVSTLTYPYNPLDAAGWEGDLCVVKLNWRDLRRQNGSGDKVPPAAYCTFVAGTFSVSTFVPRVGEGQSGMLRVPFYHSNEDMDEFVFYHRGEFFSRGEIKAGMATFHPSGFPHGPHPKSYQEKMIKAPVETDEVAVMIDSHDFLAVDDSIPDGAEWKAYVKTWEKSQETL